MEQYKGGEIKPEKKKPPCGGISEAKTSNNLRFVYQVTIKEIHNARTSAKRNLKTNYKELATQEPVQKSNTRNSQ